MLKVFIDKLSQRLRSENNLSDITWAVSEVCPIFQSMFLKFFFQDFGDNENITAFVRELSKDDSRPDFYIKTSKAEYIIECKINDKSHHFEQYAKQFPQAQFGYVANYILPSYPECKTRTWREFKNYLLDELKKNPIDKMSKLIINDYVAYLTNICSLYEIKKMTLNSLTSLIQFDRLIEKILGSLGGVETVEYDGKAKGIDKNRYGKYFSLKKIGGLEKIWPWIGVYFSADKVMLYFEINEKWCKSVYDKIDNQNLVEGTFYKEPSFDRDYSASYIFELKEEFFSKFNDDLTTSKAQENILTNYVVEILENIQSYYS